MHLEITWYHGMLALHRMKKMVSLGVLKQRCSTVHLVKVVLCASASELTYTPIETKRNHGGVCLEQGNQVGL